MASRRMNRIGARLVLLLVVMVAAAYSAPLSFTSPGTYDIGTGTSNFSNWIISGTGITSGAAVQDASNPGTISFNSTGTADLQAGFDGWYKAVLTFSLPSSGLGTSYSAVLNFSGLLADDRVVLQLNGTTIGSAGILTGNNSTMVLTDPGVVGVAGTTWTFSANGLSGTSTGFVNGTNTLTLIVNNTGTGTTGNLLNTGSTETAVSGNVVLTNIGGGGVPEPASVSYLLFGLAPLALGLARRRSRK